MFDEPTEQQAHAAARRDRLALDHDRISAAWRAPISAEEWRLRHLKRRGRRDRLTRDLFSPEQETLWTA